MMKFRWFSRDGIFFGGGLEGFGGLAMKLGLYKLLGFAH